MKFPKIPSIARGTYIPIKIQQQLSTNEMRQGDALSSLEYELLDYIHTERSPEWIQVLNAFDPQKQVNTVDALLKNLLDKGLIQQTSWPSSPPHCRVRLTPHGLSIFLIHLESVEHAKVDHKEHPRSKKQEWKQNLNKIAKVVGWIFGVLASIAAVIQFVMLIIG